MTIGCGAFGCSNEATQKLTMQTTKRKTLGGYISDDVVNAKLDRQLCDECASALFHTKHDMLEHGFVDLRDAHLALSEQLVRDQRQEESDKLLRQRWINMRTEDLFRKEYIGQSQHQLRHSCEQQAIKEFDEGKAFSDTRLMAMMDTITMPDDHPAAGFSFQEPKVDWVVPVSRDVLPDGRVVLLVPKAIALTLIEAGRDRPEPMSAEEREKDETSYQGLKQTFATTVELKTPDEREDIQTISR